MRDIWVISDTHFNHSNILKFVDDNGDRIRPFNSTVEMNEHMIERWNSVVKPGDKVYHLGDVFFGSKGWMHGNWPRLKGKKRLVVGNHDDVKFLASGAFFQKIGLWRKFPEFGLVLTHTPLHPSTLGEGRFKGREVINVHGHTHQRGPALGPYKSFCVEIVDYTPVHIEDLAARL